MNLRLLIAVAIFANAPLVALAQKDDHAPQPTLADAQNVVQTINNDKVKLKAYCELGKLQDQMAKAEDAHDTKTVDALVARSDALGQQIGPEYLGSYRGSVRSIQSPLKGRSSLPSSMPSMTSANR